MRLRKIFFGVVVGLVVLVLCAGAALYFFLKPPSYQWREITSSDNQFRVSLPSNPALVDTNEKSVDGHPFVSHMLRSSPAKGVLYVVSWWDNPAQRNLTSVELFEHLRQCDIQTFRPGFLDEKDIKFQGRPAKFTFVVTGRFFVENLAVWSGGRVYLLTILDPTTGNRERENIRRFLGSFRFIE